LTAPLHTAITVAPTALLICRHCNALRAQICLCRAECFMPHCRGIVQSAHMCCNGGTPQAFPQVRGKETDHCCHTAKCALVLRDPAVSCRTCAGIFAPALRLCPLHLLHPVLELFDLPSGWLCAAEPHGMFQKPLEDLRHRHGLHFFYSKPTVKSLSSQGSQHSPVHALLKLQVAAV
jgi:hypothetical protein